MWTNKRNVVLFALLCCALWGSAAPFIKTGYRLFAIAADDTASILLFAGLRFFLSGLMVLLMGSIVYRDQMKLPSSAVPAVLCLALFQTFLQYLFYYIGVAHTSGVNSSIISGMASFFSLILACLIFRTEQLTGRKVLGCLLGFFGIFWMNRQGVQGHFFGDAMVLIAQVSSALSANFIKVFTRRFHPVMLSGWQFAAGGAALSLIGWMMGGHLSVCLPGVLVLLYLGFLSAVAYSIWGILLSKNPVSQVSVFACSIPIFGVFISAFVLREYSAAFAWDTWTALFFVTLGIYTVTKAREA